VRLRENVQKLERVATKELKGGKSKSLKRGKATQELKRGNQKSEP